MGDNGRPLSFTSYSDFKRQDVTLRRNKRPCTDQQSNNRNSAPPGSLKNLTINNHKYLKPNGSHETQRNGTAKPYQSPRVRPPSIDSQDNKLLEIQRSLHRYSNGSVENILTAGGNSLSPSLSPTSANIPSSNAENPLAQAKQSAANHITRVISRRISKENRSGSQPNLTQLPDYDASSAPVSPRIIQPSPSMSNLSFNISKMELSRGPTVSVPPASAAIQKFQQEIPVGIRGSPDGASIRSESPLPPNEQQEIQDNISEMKLHKTPRIINHHHSKHQIPQYPVGLNQLPHKVVPSNVVMRRNFGPKTQTTNKQRYSLPPNGPPPSYNSHVMSSAFTNQNRKEIALSGSDWSPHQMRNSDYDNDTVSRPTSGYDSDMWTYGEGPPSSGPSSECHSESSYGMNQMESYGSMEGSIVHMDRVGNDDDSYYSDRRSTHDYGSHGPSGAQPMDSTYNPGSSYRVSPTTSPNQSVDKAMREEQRGKKGFFSLFRSSKPERSGLSQFSSSTNSDFYASSSKRQNFNDSRNFKTIREYSPRAFKFYMEQRVDNLLKAASERIKRKEMLEVEMRQYQMTEHERVRMRTLLRTKETNHLRLIRAKLSLEQFRIVSTLGKGAFGEVSLVQKRDTNKYYALKTLNKKEVLLRNQIAHVKAERDILKEADNEWIVKLYYSFQDGECLYFVMEYIPGGDLMSLLIKKGTFPENLARFYTAELVYAVSSVHEMGFIHRDIKPDNVLICRDGHIKLTDFGLCTGFRWTHDSNFYKESHQSNPQASVSSSSKKLNRKNHQRRKEAFSLVGTPNYIAPEVLQACAETGGGYTKSCDWWSVGVILFEMVIGYAPFQAPTPQQTQEKILAYRQTFHIPRDRPCSSQAADLMSMWVTGEDTRLSDLDFIKRHPYFEDIGDWNSIRYMHPPYVPHIESQEDISNFDPVEEYSQDDTSNYDPAITHTLQNHAFLEFTFRRFFDQDGHPQSNNHGTRQNTRRSMTQQRHHHRQHQGRR